MEGKTVWEEISLASRTREVSPERPCNDWRSLREQTLRTMLC